MNANDVTVLRSHLAQLQATHDAINAVLDNSENAPVTQAHAEQVIEKPKLVLIVGDPDAIVRLHEPSIGVPDTNPDFGGVNTKLGPADEMETAASYIVTDARMLYNRAASAANSDGSQTLAVNVLGAPDWKNIDDPRAYALDIAARYNLLP